jgi:hypothetical protein
MICPTRADCASFQQMACSLPPRPTTNTFKAIFLNLSAKDLKCAAAGILALSFPSSGLTLAFPRLFRYNISTLSRTAARDSRIAWPTGSDECNDPPPVWRVGKVPVFIKGKILP